MHAKQKTKQPTEKQTKTIPRGFYFLSFPMDDSFLDLITTKALETNRHEARSVDGKTFMAVSFKGTNPLEPTLETMFNQNFNKYVHILTEDNHSIIKQSTYKSALKMCKAIRGWENAQVLSSAKPATLQEIEQQKAIALLEEYGYDKEAMVQDPKARPLAIKHAVFITSYLDLIDR